MTLMGVGATDAFDAGASVCGVVNWETTDEKPDLYEERSPITYVEDIDVPLLVVQGANDPRVPQSEAEQL
ncbi:MAG: alpha/beta hydrolase family protein, partial [Halobacteriales archaeon]